jgi:formaldehyde-activating enzyme involved in methanogenesis
MVGAVAAAVQEVLDSLLLPLQDFLHSQQVVVVGVEVEAAGNDEDDVYDDAVSLPHLRSQKLTETSEGSLTSAKKKRHVIKKRTHNHT